MSSLRNFLPYTAMLAGVTALVLSGDGCEKEGNPIPSNYTNSSDTTGFKMPITTLKAPVVSSGSNNVGLTWTVEYPTSVSGFLIVFTQSSDTLQIDTEDKNRGSVTISNLDDGDNMVAVLAIATSGQIETPTSNNRQPFTINAVQGPALMVYPRMKSVAVGNHFTLTVRAKGVNALFAATFVIAISQPNIVQVNSVSGGTFLTSNNGYPFILLNTTAGTDSVNLATIGGHPSGVSNPGDTTGGSLIVLNCTSLAPGSTNLTIESGAKYIDTLNAAKPFQPNSNISGTVVAK